MCHIWSSITVIYLFFCSPLLIHNSNITILKFFSFKVFPLFLSPYIFILFFMLFFFFCFILLVLISIDFCFNDLLVGRIFFNNILFFTVFLANAQIFGQVYTYFFSSLTQMSSRLSPSTSICLKLQILLPLYILFFSYTIIKLAP